MAVRDNDTIEDLISEGDVRDALHGQFGTFLYQPQKSWKSSHARFNYALLVPKHGKTRRHIVVKQFIPPELKRDGPLDSPVQALYTLMHDKGRLFTAEVGNLQRIRKHLRDNFSRNLLNPDELLPRLYGGSPSSCVLVREYLNGSTTKKKLLEISAQLAGADQNGDQDSLRKRFNATFLEGIKAVAMFDGAVNYNVPVRLSQEQVNHFEQWQRLNSFLFGENFMRLFYENNQNCKHFTRDSGDQTFSKGSVEFYLASVESINVQDRLNEIDSLRQLAFYPRGVEGKIRLQHNDCNGLNQIKRHLYDLEDYGPNFRSEDPSSFSTVIGLRQDDIMSSTDLPYFLLAYVGLERAYRLQDEEGIRKLKGATNGEFKTYVEKHFSGQDYAEFLFEFLDGSINKLYTLGGTSYRHKNPAMILGTTGPFNVHQVFNLLYTVSGLGNYFTLLPSDQEKATRDLFVAQAALYKDLFHPQMPAVIIHGIKGNTAGQRLDEHLPEFRQ